MLFQSTLHAYMKLFTINGVYIKAFSKLKMDRTWFCKTLAKLRLKNGPIAFLMFSSL